jgi:hypothetical protein
MGFLFVLIAAGPAALFVAGQPDGPGAKMAAAAVAFLDSLDEAQSKKARFAFDDAERTNWHFVPNIYPGVPFSDLSSGQKRAVHRLLHTVLSGSGYHKTTTIMKLEDTLREFAEAAGRKAPHRDPGRYSVSFYGDPSKKSPWGFRLQGHHILELLVDRRQDRREHAGVPRCESRRSAEGRARRFARSSGGGGHGAGSPLDVHRRATRRHDPQSQGASGRVVGPREDEEGHRQGTTRALPEGDDR